MQAELFNQADRSHMERLGITAAEARRQLAIFAKGPQQLDLKRPCTPGDGIITLDGCDHERLLALWETAAAEGRLTAFAPASGAATRMFAFLQRLRSGPGTAALSTTKESSPETGTDEFEFQRFMNSLPEFALFEPLAKVMATANIAIGERLESGEYSEILDFLLESHGLGYGALPKALIPFHRYPTHSRTALEEHLVEATCTVRDGENRCRVHFTVAPESAEQVVGHAREAATRYGDRLGVQYILGFSEQSKATNTLAVDLDNRPFRRPDGSLLFRAGGHGALLVNLNQLEGDIVFIKNIDNVGTDAQRGPVVRHQKMLAGMLLALQDQAFNHLGLLASGAVTAEQLQEALDFAVNGLSASPPERFVQLSEKDKAAELCRLLNRPLRVCGMVRNRGEPGGGPFWVGGPSGRLSLQIVESAQVDQGAPEQLAIFAASTHFNPVQMVCGLRDFRGRPFDLHQFVDPQAVFISRKTEYGRELRALEFPGLWNGGMAYWNTVFVEISEQAFNPVKTVNDLLRSGHRYRHS